MNSRILYTKPSITEKELAYAADAAQNGWGPRCYEYVVKFEEMFKTHLGVNHAIATSSCTGALHMGLAGLGIGPGDEVILADTNWIASAAPITYVGATPVFVDILEDSWCIDPDLAEAAITPQTKAMIAVHLYGNLCAMERLLAIGRKYNIAIIEDAAEAIGSRYHGKCAGSMGIFGVFSFHGTKTITTGEGGMFVTSDNALFERVLTLSNHGRARGQTLQFWPDTIGFKYKMANIPAAVGCAQLERVGELVARKRDIMEMYRQRFNGVAALSMNPEPAGCINGSWMPTVVFDSRSGITREKLFTAFTEDNIDARVFFHPLTTLPMFSGRPGGRLAREIAARAINLPSYHDMAADEIERVVRVVESLVG